MNEFNVVTSDMEPVSRRDQHHSLTFLVMFRRTARCLGSSMGLQYSVPLNLPSVSGVVDSWSAMARSGTKR